MKKNPDDGTPSKARAASKRSGGTTAIRGLIDEGFFANRRTLPQIQEFLRKKKVLSFKPNQLSSPLAKLTRRGELQREENDDGTFEYWAD
jgi:hypothetical protein